MKPFAYHRAGAAEIALEHAQAGARYLGGGTNLVDLMREGIEQPEVLVDITPLPHAIVRTTEGGLRIDGATRNTAVASSLEVRRDYPALARAILSGASAQIRNVATVAGNLMQRTRCMYFYDQAARCNKRVSGSGCDAREGFNRMHAVLGASSQCVATHPSDMCVALAALDAQVQLRSGTGTRTIPLVDFHRLPGDQPERDTVLEPGELITAVLLPPPASGQRSTYRKVRDRASYAFALVSVAAVLEQTADGTIQAVRIAWGGVAHKPWRATRLEAALLGDRLSPAAIEEALDAELRDASPLTQNAFKLPLLRRTTAAVLAELAGDQT